MRRVLRFVLLLFGNVIVAIASEVYWHFIIYLGTNLDGGWKMRGALLILSRE